MRLHRGSATGHNHIIKHLSAYIDGELSPRLRRKVERHLDACADCRRELESLRATVTLMRRMPVLAPPRDFTLPLSMQKAPRARGWDSAFGALRLASVAGTFMLVLRGSGALLLGAGRLSLPAPAAPW
jgi:anti-sigma factor RsiW